MSAIMIVIGSIITRLSKRDRGIGRVTMLIGVGALVAYFAGGDGSVPDSTVTPAAEIIDPFVSATTPANGN